VSQTGEGYNVNSDEYRQRYADGLAKQAAEAEQAGDNEAAKQLRDAALTTEWVGAKAEIEAAALLADPAKRTEAIAAATEKMRGTVERMRGEQAAKPAAAQGAQSPAQAQPAAPRRCVAPGAAGLGFVRGRRAAAPASWDILGG
jgi:hypothetical protein